MSAAGLLVDHVGEPIPNGRRKFHFNLSNHTPMGRESLTDPANILGAQLVDLGHQAARGDARMVKPPGINVLFEGFNRTVNDRLATLRAQGLRFIIVSTEKPGPSGFNNQTEGELVSRLAHFPRAAAMADAIWCLVPEAVPWMRQHNPHVAAVELGYSHRLKRPPSAEPPTFDFGFFGSPTPRRLEVLKQFQAAGFKMHVVGHFPDGNTRDIQMQQCKVILQIKPNPNWTIISSSRCNTALHLGRPVVAEPHNSDSPWKRIIRFSGPVTNKMTRDRGQVTVGALDARNFIAAGATALADWEAEYARQIKAFERILPATVLGEAVDATLSHLPTV